jgi:hypothetical protein
MLSKPRDAILLDFVGWNTGEFCLSLLKFADFSILFALFQSLLMRQSHAIKKRFLQPKEGRHGSQRVPPRPVYTPRHGLRIVLINFESRFFYTCAALTPRYPV